MNNTANAAGIISTSYQKTIENQRNTLRKRLYNTTAKDVTDLRKIKYARRIAGGISLYLVYDAFHQIKGALSNDTLSKTERLDLVGDGVLDIAFTAVSFVPTWGFAVSVAYISIDVSLEENAFSAIRRKIYSTINRHILND